jgi:hypothetical protein
MLRTITEELRDHAPFTVLGAITGLVVMVLLHKIPYRISYNVFYILHPAHVLLSAVATASMYELHITKKRKLKLWGLILVGYLGSVGIATLSDSVIPYLGEVLLDLPNKGIHIGFIEEWWLVNPLAFAGIAIAYFRPTTKFPHAWHVLLSTWASSFHIIMAVGGILSGSLIITALIFLFISVWIPCCMSDIVFPLLFVGKNAKKD